MNIKIYMTNLAKYNEGQLIGQWIDLPIDSDDLEEQINEILGDDEEYFISDYEAPFKISEYSNPFQINEQAGLIQELSSSEEETLMLLLETSRFKDINEAIECLKHEQFIIYKECKDMEDVVLHYVNMIGGGFKDAISNLDRYLNLPEHYEDTNIDDLPENTIEKYFNMKQYIYDIEIEEDYEKVGEDVYIQFLS